MPATTKTTKETLPGGDGDSGQMRPIGRKIETLRKAWAESIVVAGAQTLKRLKENDLPKKDVLPMARAAGVLAAKRTADLIPYCHPIPIDVVEIHHEIQADRVLVRAYVESVAKTGVEMEALTAASIAALTVYDMLKPVDKDITIETTRLLKKKGGKSDFGEWIAPGFKAAVIVTSDGTFAGKRQDKSGRIIQETLRGHGLEPRYEVLPDDKVRIQALLETLCKEGTQLIVTTGGTGLGPRDVTVEATRAIMDREIPGVMEAARGFGQRRTPYAMLSRGLAAQKGATLILNLPGSSAGVRESLDAIFPGILHAYGMMTGGGH